MLCPAQILGYLRTGYRARTGAIWSAGACSRCLPLGLARACSSHQPERCFVFCVAVMLPVLTEEGSGVSRGSAFPAVSAGAIGRAPGSSALRLGGRAREISRRRTSLRFPSRLVALVAPASCRLFLVNAGKCGRKGAPARNPPSARELSTAPCGSITHLAPRACGTKSLQNGQ